MRRLITVLFIAVLIAPAAQAAEKPAYLVEAEHNYRRARAELKAAQNALAEVTQQEARLGRKAMRLHMLALSSGYVETAPRYLSNNGVDAVLN